MNRTCLIVTALCLALAACGKMGPPEKPPGATWPKGYPSGAVSHGVLGLPNSGNDVSEQSTAKTPVATSKGAAFTKDGAWIDPDMNRPVINPTADQDKYHLNENVVY